MIYLLDTSVLIDMLRGEASADAFVDRHESDTLLTSTVCVFEVASGIERSHPTTIEKKRQAFRTLLESLTEVISVTSEDALYAGRIWADLTGKGQKIDDLDVLIAATTMKVGATVVTGNRRHFERIPGLPVVGIES